MKNLEHTSITLAKRLKALRKSKNLSHEALTQALLEQYGVNISTQSLINYEVDHDYNSKFKKNMGMNINYLRCLADFYNVSTDYLLGLTDIANRDTTIQAVCEYTGLSALAIEAIRNCNEPEPLLLDVLLTQPSLTNFLLSLLSLFSQKLLYEHVENIVKHETPDFDTTSLNGKLPPTILPSELDSITCITTPAQDVLVAENDKLLLAEFRLSQSSDQLLKNAINFLLSSEDANQSVKDLRASMKQGATNQATSYIESQKPMFEANPED